MVRYHYPTGGSVFESVDTKASTVTVDADADIPLTIDHDGATYHYETLRLKTADSGVGPFTIAAKNDSVHNTTRNHTLSWGYNADSEGNQIDSTEPTIRNTAEAKFDDGTNVFMEYHVQGVYADGTSWRSEAAKISRDGSADSTRTYRYENVTYEDDPVAANASARIQIDFPNNQITWKNPLTHKFVADDGTEWNVEAGNLGRFQYSAGGSGVPEMELWPADGAAELRLQVPINYENATYHNTTADSMTANPESGTEDGYIEVQVEGNTKQIPYYNP